MIGVRRALPLDDRHADHRCRIVQRTQRQARRRNGRRGRYASCSGRPWHYYRRRGPVGGGASEDIFGQPFVVENRPGAGATLGARHVARAAPDGYTLLMGGNTTHSSTPSLFKSPPYDPVADFTPVARIGKLGQFLSTNPSNRLRLFKRWWLLRGPIPASCPTATGTRARRSSVRRSSTNSTSTSYASPIPAIRRR